jgi:hypothetical protein
VLDKNINLIKNWRFKNDYSPLSFLCSLNYKLFDIDILHCGINYWLYEDFFQKNVKLKNMIFELF